MQWLPLRFVVIGPSLYEPLFTRIDIEGGGRVLAAEVPSADVELMKRVRDADGWVCVTPGSRSQLDHMTRPPTRQSGQMEDERTTGVCSGTW